MQYVIYYRVSTDKQGAKGLGMDSQKSIVNHFIDSDSIVAEYEEVLSGGKLLAERPQLQLALADCVANGYTLVTAKVDRLSRHTETALDIYAQLNGRLICLDIPNLDKFTLTLFMAIADRELELISVRIKSALTAKKERVHSLWSDKQWEALASELSSNPDKPNPRIYTVNDVKNKSYKQIKSMIFGDGSNATTAGRNKGASTNKNKAIDAYAKQMTYIKMLRDDKGLSYRAIAEQLNSDGYETRQGKQYKAMTVKRMLDR